MQNGFIISLFYSGRKRSTKSKRLKSAHGLCECSDLPYQSQCYQGNMSFTTGLAQQNWIPRSGVQYYISLNPGCPDMWNEDNTPVLGIGAGFVNPETQSLNDALEMLYRRSCYHMFKLQDTG
ncbi:hypothetical protein FGIG_09515 [Fasciola gigantica]|uniref:Uncharacterized protein n=1 Tax=Fasciola gigantica TaxID=46835 RepID=A0A504YYI6_FASGI|nr:hypothetical protein FGIG_09515 [Fasciola gigantica]